MNTDETRIPLWLCLVLVPVVTVAGAFMWSMLFAIIEVLS